MDQRGKTATENEQEGARLFLSMQHPTTRRWAILEDDGTSAWLYVTGPDTLKPVGDCFVYSARPPAAEVPKDWFRGSPPPITTVYASPTAYRPDLPLGQVAVTWAADGRAAAVFVGDEPVAFLIVGQLLGYSRAVATDGPWGHPWDEGQFERYFG
jgi:hypothetical protein